MSKTYHQRRTRKCQNQKELNKIKEEVETVNKKLQELTEEELEQVTGGATGSLKPFSGEKGFGFIDSKQARITTNYPLLGDDE